MPPTLPVIYNTFHHGRIQLSLLSPQHGHDQMRHLLSSRNCSQILQGAGGKSGRWWDPVWVDSAAQGQHFSVRLLLGDAPSDMQSSGPARWLFAATGAGGCQQLCLAKEAGREQPERPVLCRVWICFTRSAHLGQSFGIPWLLSGRWCYLKQASQKLFNPD